MMETDVKICGFDATVTAQCIVALPGDLNVEVPLTMVHGRMGVILALDYKPALDAIHDQLHRNPHWGKP